MLSPHPLPRYACRHAQQKFSLSTLSISRRVRESHVVDVEKLVVITVHFQALSKQVQHGTKVSNLH